MKKITITAISILLFSFCIAQRVKLSKDSVLRMKAPLHRIIETMAQIKGYTVQYKDEKPTAVDEVTLLMSLPMDELLSIICQNEFTYTINNKQIEISDYYQYSLDTNQFDTNAYIKTYYDTTRDAPVLAFKHIRPEIVLDSVLHILRLQFKNQVVDLDTTYVSGILPLIPARGELLFRLFDAHNWVFESDAIYKKLIVQDKVTSDQPAETSIYYDERFKSQIIKFKHASFYTILELYASQYNYTVVYQAYQKRLKTISGYLPLNASFNFVLNQLGNNCPYQFNIEGKTIFVIKYKP